MNRTARIIISILLIYIFCLLNFNGCNNQQKIVEIEKTDTVVINDTITHTDTITITKTKQVYREIVKTDTVFNEKGDTIQLVTENKLYKDTLCSQNDSIILESSITGINPRLDWIKADWRKQEIIKTVTITNTIEKKKCFIDKFHISPNASFGYGLFNKKLDLFIGIGINFDL